MSSAIGRAPSWPDFTADDLSAFIQQMQQAQADAGGLNPTSPALPRSAGEIDLTGRGTGPIDQRRQPQFAGNEGQVQGLERAMASPQDLAALGAPQGSPDALLYDRTGMGGGANAFHGSADPYGSRMVPLPPVRPDASALPMPQPDPATTGGVQGMNPGAGGGPQRQIVAASRAVPVPGTGTTAPVGTIPDGTRPADSFDPLTGAVTSGSPTPLGARPGLPQVPAAPGGQQPNILERFVSGVNNPAFSDLMLHLGIGLLSNRGIGPGIGAGLASYQSSQAGSLKSQLEQIKFAQEQQGQQDTYSHLVNNLKLDPTAARAAMRNPTVLSNLLTQASKDPQQFTFGGKVYLGRPDQPRESWQELGPSAGPPAGFQPRADGGLDPTPGGPQSLDYKAAEAGAIARAKNAETPDKPIRARPGDVIVDPSTYKPLYEAPGNKPQGFETEDKLRTEFSKQLGTFGQVHDGYGRVIAATKQREDNPSTPSPASDIGLIFGYMKMLDPGSVVREGEYATAKNATGVPERVLNAYNKALNGEFLSDAQRRDFLGQAAELYGTARNTANGVADRYRGLAQQYGVSPDRSVYLPDMPTPPRIGGGQGQPAQAARPAPTGTPTAPQGAPDGTRLAPDGKFYAPDPKRPGRFLEVR